MAQGNFDIVGAAELKKALGEFTPNLEKNVLRGALREAALVIEREAKVRAQGAIGGSGRLRESIRVSAGAKRGGRIWAHIKAGGRKKGDAFYAHFVEFGTRPHEIRPKKALSMFFAGLFHKVIKHPGARKKPFMRPAFDSKAGEALDVFTKYVRARIEKLGKKK